MNVETEIEILVRARTPLIYVYSSEERRVLETLKRITTKLTAEAVGEGNRADVQLLMWSVVSGLLKWDDDSPVGTNTNSAVAVLQHAAAIKGSAIVALRDYHPYLQEPAIVRRLRELAISFSEGDKNQLRVIVIISPKLVIPPELEKEIALVDFPLPSREDLENVIDHVQTEAQDEGGEFAVNLNENGRSDVAQALLGLTITEAENTLAKSIVVTGELGAKAIPLILKEKEQIVKKSGGGAVEYIAPRCTVDDIGGLDLLKGWAIERSESWGPRAAQFKLIPPRGVLLIGEPGVGKSLSVKAIVSLWQVPLLRLDIGALFTSALGGTEEKMRGVLKLADSLGRCARSVWLDEVEKGLSGLGSSNLSDGGAQARIFATLLTWMEEHESPVFVAATANLTTLDVLPPEFIQRFSEMFWLDKPNEAERAQILNIHLKDRGLNPDEFDIARLVTETQGMVGRHAERATWCRPRCTGPSASSGT